MNLGLIGPGRHGKRYLEERNGGRHVVAVCRRGDSLDDLLAKVDGVIVATPPNTHRDIVLAALRAGKDVLCEKPLALTWEDCKAMLDAAEAAGRRLVIAHQHLWADGFAKHLGAPVSHVGAVSGGAYGHDYSAWFDWGTHDVAMAIAAFGVAPVRVWIAEEGRRLYGARLQFECGGADILTGLLPAKVRAFQAQTTRGGWSYDGTFEPGREPMRLMVEAFVEGETAWRSSIDFGRAVCRALFGVGGTE